MPKTEDQIICFDCPRREAVMPHDEFIPLKMSELIAVTKSTMEGHGEILVWYTIMPEIPADAKGGPAMLARKCNICGKRHWGPCAADDLPSSPKPSERKLANRSLDLTLMTDTEVRRLYRTVVAEHKRRFDPKTKGKTK